MSSRSLSLLTSVMSNIDDLKDKISDGEYLTLCNLLKSLNDEIKNSSSNEEEYVEQQILNDYDDRTRPLSERIKSFVEDGLFPISGGQHPEVSFNDILEAFKQYLLDIYENEEENQDLNRWFRCSCCCTVAFRDIPEHLETENHKDNFQVSV